MSSRFTTETKKRADDDGIDQQQQQVLPIDSKRMRLDDIPVVKKEQLQQSLAISPVESPFRTIGDQKVPSTDLKKDTSKTVRWSEEIQTFETVNIVFQKDELMNTLTLIRIL